TPRTKIIVGGALFGLLGALAVNLGNPLNMGICSACFLRDVTGALNLHQAGPVQYLRPEIMGFVLGAFITAMAFGEFRSRGGSAPLIRFVLGALMMIGALVFLGCPIRMLLRLAGGDMNALVGLAGLIFGVLIGIFFLKKGFNLGRSVKMPAIGGYILPAVMIGLLIFAFVKPGFINASTSGPGSQSIAVWTALLIGLGVGFMAQRTRFCSVGGWRDVILVKDFHLLSGIIAFLLAALIMNAILGNFNAGGLVVNGVDVHYSFSFENQPAAHTQQLWNFFGLGLVGLTAVMLGGCPFRNLILTGEGDNDAAITVLGMIAGAAIAHIFGIAASGAGIGTNGPTAMIIGWVFCIGLGLIMVLKKKTA
ncbi:YedE family putative selenium transporter, partial [Chloroflexota bacterium]